MDAVTPRPDRKLSLRELDMEYRYLAYKNLEAKLAGVAWLVKLSAELKQKLYEHWQKIENDDPKV